MCIFNIHLCAHITIKIPLKVMNFIDVIHYTITGFKLGMYSLQKAVEPKHVGVK